MASPTDVNTPSLAYRTMAPHLELPRTLFSGTMAMQNAGILYLPREPKESVRNYQIRLQRSVLFPALRQTIEAIGSKPFVKPATLSDKSPTQLQDLVSDVDLTGRDLSTFANEIYCDALLDGYAAILVDYPRVEAGLTLAQERELNARPYFIPVLAQDLIEVKTKRIGGQNVIERCRIRVREVEADGEWGQKEVVKVRVIYPDRFEVYGQDAQKNWRIESSTPNTLGKVPLVPIYTGWVSPFYALPPLEDLAYLNLKHWQSQSDQDHILHVARVPILFGAGFAKDEVKTIEVGASSMTRSVNANAKMEFVEHTGSAIGAGRESLNDLKWEMSVLGYEPLVSQARPGDVTATGRAIDMAEVNSRAQAWARGCEMAFESAFNLAGEWMGIKDAQVDVKMNTEFGLSLREAKDLQLLFETRKAGDLSRDTYWSELRRRGILPDEFDPQAEAELLDREPPPLAQMGGLSKFFGGGETRNGAQNGVTNGGEAGAVQ